jgi:hypothetical protein
VPSSKRYAAAARDQKSKIVASRRSSSAGSTSPAAISTLRPVSGKLGTAQRCTGSIWVVNRCPARPSSSGGIARVISAIASG